MLHNITNEITICENVIVARSFLKRLRGLMFTKELSQDTAMFIYPCRQIHTFFMNYNIDVLYLNHNNTVLAIDEDLKPGMIGKKVKGAVAVIELPGGRTKQTNTEVGQVVQVNKGGEGNDFRNI